jgi:hypothetical protein
MTPIDVEHQSGKEVALGSVFSRLPQIDNEVNAAVCVTYEALYLWTGGRELGGPGVFADLVTDPADRPNEWEVMSKIHFPPGDS